MYMLKLEKYKMYDVPEVYILTGEDELTCRLKIYFLF